MTDPDRKDQKVMFKGAMGYKPPIHTQALDQVGVHGINIHGMNIHGTNIHGMHIHGMKARGWATQSQAAWVLQEGPSCSTSMPCMALPAHA